MRIGAILQVRMSSQRFPGKVLCEVAGKVILQYLLERLECCRNLDLIVVATSRDETDVPIEKFCKEYGVKCYRGPLLNVAARFKEILDRYTFDAFVRVNGDSPLLDTRLIEKGMDIFLNGDYDIVTNTLRRTYPIGQSVEIVHAEIFRTAYELMQGEEELEHVTKYFYKNKEKYRIFNFESEYNYSRTRLSIDERDDLKTFIKIISKMNKPHWEYKLEDILNIYRDQLVKC